MLNSIIHHRGEQMGEPKLAIARFFKLVSFGYNDWRFNIFRVGPPTRLPQALVNYLFNIATHLRLGLKQHPLLT